MAVEIERKFLVANNEWMDERILRFGDLEQGYFQRYSDPVVRVRIDGDQAFLTIKSGHQGMKRSEYEYEIPLVDAQELSKVCEQPPIKKTRYKLVDQFNQLWDIDMFHGVNEGLIVAEIELASEDQVVTLPTWIGKEVTNDERYRNTNLAADEVPKE